jgi:hypothetical protein
MVYWIVNGKEYGEEEYRELENQGKAEKEAERIARWEAEEKARQEAAHLMRQLGAAYTAYDNFLQAHPQLRLRVTDAEAADHDVYHKLRQNLGHADEAPRCAHTKADGRRCGSPRMKTGALCYAHQRMAEARPQALRLPPMEDPNAIQLGLMEVARALIDRQITEKTAGLLFYGLQTAAANVDRLTFHEAPQEMVLDDDEPVITAETGKQEGFSYEMLDQDLKLRLQEIGDEMDRRLRERCTERRANAAMDSGRELALMDPNEEEIHRGEAEPPEDPESLTTEDTREHRGEPGIGEPETGFAAETLYAGMQPQPNY